MVFIGTAPGHRSAAERAYYAHPGNRFWPTLRELGLIPANFDAPSYRALLSSGIGFTDVCKTQQGSDRVISAYDPRGLSRKIARYEPYIVAFTSKKAAGVWYGCSTQALKYGVQPQRDAAEPIIFVLPSPSGAASGHWQIKPWRDLADLVSTRQRPLRTAHSPG